MVDSKNPAGSFIVLGLSLWGVVDRATVDRATVDRGVYTMTRPMSSDGRPYRYEQQKAKTVENQIQVCSWGGNRAESGTDLVYQICQNSAGKTIPIPATVFCYEVV